MSSIFIATKAIPGKHKNVQDEICTDGQKRVSGPISQINFFSMPCDFLVSYFNPHLQSTCLLEWNSLVSPSVSTVSAKQNVYGPGPPPRQFPDLALCSLKQSISIELTLSVRRIGYCLLTDKSFYLLNKYLSSYGGMFIKTKSISIKTKAVW